MGIFFLEVHQSASIHDKESSHHGSGGLIKSALCQIDTSGRLLEASYFS